MASQRSTLEMYLVELLDPRTSPEKALETLSIYCLTPEAYTKIDCEPVIIFLGYMKFIMTRCPEGRLESIWQEIMKKAISFTRFMPGGMACNNGSRFLPYINSVRYRYRYSSDTFPWVVPEIVNQMDTWLEVALSTHNKCLNPYMKLEMIRLMRLVDRYYLDDGENKEWLCKMFINTICEISPHQLFTSKDEDFLFGVADLKFVFKSTERIFSTFIYDDILRARFLSHLIQLFGVISDIKGSDPVIKISYYDYHTINVCILGSIWHRFEHVVSQPPILHYLVEVISEFTADAINNKAINTRNHKSLMFYRNQIARDLKVVTNPCDLPKLLLSRQITGQPRAVRKHGLLISNLKPFYKNLGQTRRRLHLNQLLNQILRQQHLHQ